MNNDSEAIEQFLAWLLQDSAESCKSPSGERSRPSAEPYANGSAGSLFKHLDKFDSEGEEISHSNLEDSNPFSFQEIPIVEPGDVPAVQDRFQTLIKQRLRSEIERRPPLFPWETELCDYDEAQDASAPKLVPVSLWTSQLQQLRLPVPMPLPLLSKLFEQCHALAKSSLQDGVKLVQAVQEFFPGESQSLHQLAGMVMTAPTRSGTTLASPRLGAGFPAHYDAASLSQKMALSLVAAREILNTLTIDLSLEQPTAERQWMTAFGLLTIAVEFVEATQQIRVRATLPCLGRIQMEAESAKAIAERSASGDVGLELYDIRLDQTYSLTVCLNRTEALPLTFAIRILEDTLQD